MMHDPMLYEGRLVAVKWNGERYGIRLLRSSDLDQVDAERLRIELAFALASLKQVSAMLADAVDSAHERIGNPGKNQPHE